MAVVTTVFAIYASSLLLRVDVVQHRVAEYVSLWLKETVDVPLQFGAVRVRHFNKIEIDDVLLSDADGDTVASIGRLTAHLSPLQLLRNRVRVNTLTLERPRVIMSRENPQAPLNIQFLLELLAGNDSLPSAPLPYMSVGQLHLYDGQFAYHVWSEERGDTGIFTPSHIEVDDISANISLRCLTSDTISIYIRSMKGKEVSGLHLQRVTAQIGASKRAFSMSDFCLKQPGSEIKADNITASYIYDEKEGRLGNLRFKGCIESRRFDFASLSPLSPVYAERMPVLSFKIPFRGSDTAVFMEQARLGSEGEEILLKASASIEKLSNGAPEYSAEVEQLLVTPEGMDMIHHLMPDDSNIDDVIDCLGGIDLSGRLQACGYAISGALHLDAECGSAEVFLESDSEGAYKGNAKLAALDLGKIVGNDALGTCDVECSSEGSIAADGRIDATFSGAINSLMFNEYTYEPINAGGTITNEGIDVRAEINDKNLSAAASFSLSDKRGAPRYDFQLRVDSVNLYNLALSDNSNSGVISFNMVSGFADDKAGNSYLEANVYDFKLNTGGRFWKIPHANLLDTSIEGNRNMVFDVGFAKGSASGRFKYSDLFNSVNRVLQEHLPSLASSVYDADRANSFVFNAEIQNSEILSTVFSLPFAINSPSSINIGCDDHHNHIRAAIHLNDAELLGRRYRSLDANIHSKKSGLSCELGMVRPVISEDDASYDDSSNDIAIEVNSVAVDDTLKNNILWRNIGAPVNKGNLDFNVALSSSESEGLNVDVNFNPSTIIYCDSLWTLSECSLTGNLDRFCINKVELRNNNRMLRVDGAIGHSDSDSLMIDLHDVVIEDLFDIANFHPVDFGGVATGKVKVSRILSSPMFSSELVIDSFKFERGYMGRMLFNGEWNEEKKAVLLHGRIEDGLNTTLADGFVSPANDTINIRLRANAARLDFLNHMLDGILSDVEGHTSGELYIRGRMKDINLYGALVPEGKLRIAPTNVVYNLLGDTVIFSYNEFRFTNLRITDRDGNSGLVNGAVKHNSLKNFTCYFDIDADNLLAYDTHEFGDDGFYGRAFVTGRARFSSDDSGINLHADVTAENNSRFVYNAAGPEGATDNKFVTFIDSKGEKRGDKYTPILKTYDDTDDFMSRLRMEFMVTATPGLQLRVYTNTLSGDYIDIYGNGLVSALYDEKEGFSMGGTLDLTRGTYKFTLQDIFPKEFAISSGSTLTFNGDPFMANLNLKTVYTVPSAPLTDLSITAERKKNVRVSCLMDITGTLLSPNLTFGIELPDGNEEERELLASATSSPELTNMQFIYLVGIGKFYPYDYNNQDAENQSSSAMESLISSTISGQLNNMLSQITDNDNWDISGNFTTSERGWNSMEVEGMLSGRLLDNRLLINGNFGYRENPLANKNFIGDFEVQWLLNKSGNISLKAYNKTNDRYFSKTTLTTQGAGILLRHDFDHLLFWQNKRNKNKQVKQSADKKQ